MTQIAGASEIEKLVQAALAAYGFSPSATYRLANVSENWIFRVDDTEQGRSVALRVHRPNYHSREEIESELTWIDSLMQANVVNVPAPVAARDGSRVQTLSVPELDEPRHVSAFEWLPGAAPSTEEDLTANFERLGEVAAKMHLHGMRWNPPSGFQRFTYDDHAVFDKALWGRWEDAPGVEAAERDVLSRVEAEIRQQLARHGRAREIFGICHNDLRLANLLLDGERLTVIDFDDCGYCWYMNDFATAVSFLEHDERVGEWMDAWTSGYARQRELSAADRELLPTLIMLRRMLLVGWVGFHYKHAPEARALGAPYTKGACRIGEKYLAGRFLA